MNKTQIVKQFKSVPLKTNRSKDNYFLWVAAGAVTAAVVGYTAFKVFKPKNLSLPLPEELETTKLQYPKAEDDALEAWIEADLEELSSFAVWAKEQLPNIDEEKWHAALGEGKWSLHEVLAHLYYWDKYTLEEMLPLMAEGANLKFVEIQSLNDKAWAFAKTFEKDLLLELFVATRLRLVQMFKEIENKSMAYQLGSGEANLHSYLKIFVHHDTEHKPQFEAALEPKQTQEN